VSGKIFKDAFHHRITLLEKINYGIWTQEGKNTYTYTQASLPLKFSNHDEVRKQNGEFEIVPDLKVHIISFKTIKIKPKRIGDDVRWGSAKSGL
jgi:hypothetical protein